MSTQEGERRFGFSPDHPKRRKEDIILGAIADQVEKAMSDPASYMDEEGHDTEGIAMLRNDAGTIIASAMQAEGGRMLLTIMSGGSDALSLSYSDKQSQFQQTPIIVGTERFLSGSEVKTFTPHSGIYTDSPRPAEYTARLTGIALRIGALKPTAPIQAKGR